MATQRSLTIGCAYLADPADLPSPSVLKVPEPKVTKNRLHLDEVAVTAALQLEIR